MRAVRGLFFLSRAMRGLDGLCEGGSYRSGSQQKVAAAARVGD